MTFDTPFLITPIGVALTLEYASHSVGRGLLLKNDEGYNFKITVITIFLIYFYKLLHVICSYKDLI